MWCICALLLIQPMAVFATILGPGLLTPALVVAGPTDRYGQADQDGQAGGDGSGNTEGPNESGGSGQGDEDSPYESEEPDVNGNSGQTGEPSTDPTQDPAEALKAEQRKIAREEAAEAGFLVLINKTNTVDSNFKPDDLTSIKYFASNRSESGRYMRAEAADHFHSLVEAAADQDLKIVMTTAYRSFDFQKILWDNYVAKDGEAAASRYSARPGTSEHQSGLAVDVSSPSVSYELTRDYANTTEGKWLAENAHRFGFIIRYPKGKEDITGYIYEPWHLRYVSESVAQEIYEADITLEEYLEWYF